MQALAERARQALGVGQASGFVASSLEPQHKTMEELAVYAAPLRNMVSSAEHFKDDTTEFLEESCRFIRNTPFPRLWTQTSPLEAAEALHTPVPAEHAAWFDAETHNSLAEQLAPAVGFALQRELLGPMKQWLLAYDVLKTHLSRLESTRLAYDAERRRLAAAVAKAADAAAAGAAQSVSTDVPSAAGTIAAAVQVAQMHEEAAAASPFLSEYEADAEALDDGLAWLVSGALRLKALIADTAGGVAAAARGWQVPQGLMPELEASTFGKGYEVTLTVTDAPLGAETLLGPEAPPQATTATPDLVAVRADDDDGEEEEGCSRREAAGGKTVVGSMMPSDESMVYGGGVAPPPAAHSPPGGGVAQLIKDTVVGPGSESADEAYHDAHSDDHSNDAAAAAAAGSSAAGDESEQASGSAADGGSGGGLIGKFRDTVARLVGTSGQEDTAAGAGAAAGSSDDVDPIDPHELMSDRPSRSYSGSGVGQVEARLCDVAVAGVGAAGRHLRRARSEEGQVPAAAAAVHTGLAVSPGVQIPDADKKQLSTVVLSGSPTAAVAAAAVADSSGRDADNAFVDNAGTQSLTPSADTPATAAVEHDGTTAAGDGSGAVSGLFAAISRTIQEGRARLSGSSQRQQQQQAGDVDQGAETSTEPASSGWKVEVQGAEESGAPGAPGTPASVAAAPEPEVNPAAAAESREGVREGMHVGPVAPYPGHIAAPGTAEYVKDAEAPGGAAAAAGHQSAFESSSTDTSDVGSGMHIGPVSPFPGAEPAPGSAHYEKGPTPPGGAAAAGSEGSLPEAANISSNEAAYSSGMHVGPVSPAPGSQPAPGTAHYIKGPTPPGGAAAAAEAPAGSSEEGPTAAGAGAPDVPSKLSGREQPPVGGTTTKPAGGGVATFIRDTLLGPPKDQ